MSTPNGTSFVVGDRERGKLTLELGFDALLCCSVSPLSFASPLDGYILGFDYNLSGSRESAKEGRERKTKTVPQSDRVEQLLFFSFGKIIWSVAFCVLGETNLSRMIDDVRDVADLD